MNNPDQPLLNKEAERIGKNIAAFASVSGSTASNVASRIVASIVSDIEDRKGLGNEWEMIDSKTRLEIITVWKRIAVREIER